MCNIFLAVLKYDYKHFSLRIIALSEKKSKKIQRKVYKSVYDVWITKYKYLNII